MSTTQQQEDSNNRLYPQSFYCPITLQLMKDPYCDKDGNSYEGDAIKQWVQAHGHSPITRNPLTLADLAPNRALKDLIEQTVSGSSNNGSNNYSSQNQSSADHVYPTPEQISVRGAFYEPENLLHISLAVADCPKRFPVDICCVIDVSGSMDTEVSIKNESGQAETNGLSTLDVVKHAVRTIISSLGEDDSVSIVSFSDDAVVDLEPTKCSSAGRGVALRSVESLVTRGSTNLWAGLKSGLEVMQSLQTRQQNGPKRMKSLLLLTDGQPNVEPPRGHVPMLKLYKDKHDGRYPCSINTFGFGYSLDSALLDELAYEGNGSYAFIPDAAMVGTIFINAISNLLVTAADHIVMKVESSQTLSDECLPGGFPVTITSWGAQVEMGSLQLGQSRDLVIKLPSPPAESDEISHVSVSLEIVGDDKVAQRSVPITRRELTAEEHLEIRGNFARLKAASALKQSVKDQNDAAIRVIIQAIQTVCDAFPDSKRIAGLLKDVSGEGCLACNTNHFQRWGRHYLPSLARAHQLQQCNNFKDPGVQFYAGSLFSKIRDTIDEIFDKLPPPAPSVQHHYSGPPPVTAPFNNFAAPNTPGGIPAPAMMSAPAPAPTGARSLMAKRSAPRFEAESSSSMPSSAPVNMSAFNNRNNPCFNGECMVNLANGALKRIDQLRSGDFIATGDGYSEVDLILETLCSEGILWFVEIAKGLLITPWHPIFYNGKWTFPIEVGKPKLVRCTAVYSIMLKEGFSLIVNNIKCVSLGNGCAITDGICYHPFFSDKHAILKNLRFAHNNDGVVTVKCVHRNQTTGLVDGFVLNEESDVKLSFEDIECVPCNNI